MSKKKKIGFIVIFFVLLVIVAIVANRLNKKETSDNEKNFTIEIVSERDGYHEEEECTSSEETLGAYIRTQDFVTWEDSEYGMYIIEVSGMSQDIDNQYWWCITVDDQEVSLGADSIPLTDGSKYTFTLLQGWE